MRMEKLFIVALKYEGETECRHLVANELGWRTLDIVSAYSLRWLIEVFFEDWKLYEGWDGGGSPCNRAKRGQAEA
jgi:hypothetical protein